MFWGLSWDKYMPTTITLQVVREKDAFLRKETNRPTFSEAAWSVGEWLLQTADLSWTLALLQRAMWTQALNSLWLSLLVCPETQGCFQLLGTPTLPFPLWVTTIVKLSPDQEGTPLHPFRGGKFSIFTDFPGTHSDVIHRRKAGVIKQKEKNRH